MSANAWRGALAYAAVNTHALASHGGGEPLETQLIDLLTNLRHLADANGIDIDLAWRTSADHHDAEKEPTT